MDIIQVMADPLSFGANLIIYGTLQGADKTRLVAVDMGVLLTRNCTRPPDAARLVVGVGRLKTQCLRYEGRDCD